MESALFESQSLRMCDKRVLLSCKAENHSPQYCKAIF